MPKPIEKKTSNNNANNNVQTTGLNTLLTALKNTFTGGAQKKQSVQINQNTQNVQKQNAQKQNVQNKVSAGKPVVNNTAPRTIQNRSNFSSDRDYENYLLDNRIDTTKGDARDYLRQKASEQNTLPRQYLEGMRTRYKSYKDTQDVRNKVESGRYGENVNNDINQRFGAVIDENNNEVDINQYNKDIELVQTTADNLKNKQDKIDKDYQDGKIDYNTYLNESNKITNAQNENANVAQRLGNYTVKQGFDYYDWALENGKNVDDFELYVGQVNNNIVENLLLEWTATEVDRLNRIPQSFDTVVKLLNPEYEGNELSRSLRQTAEQIHEFAYSSGDQINTLTTQTLGALMPMIQDRLDASFLSDLEIFGRTIDDLQFRAINGKTVQGEEAYSTLMAGFDSVRKTFQQRIDEGNSPFTAIMNALAHGAITAQVEGANAGDITNILLGGPDKWIASIGMFNKANPMQILGYLDAVGRGEGAEEVIESLLDYGVDNLQNFIWGGLTGERINADALDPKEMASEYLMAYAGTVLLGVPDAVNITINTKQKYNAVMEAKAHCESVLASDATQKEKDLASRVIELVDYGLRDFESKSTDLTEGVELSRDRVPSMPTYNELMVDLANAMKPDIREGLETAQQTLDTAKNVRGMLQDALIDRGVFMRAEDFANKSVEERDELLKIGKFNSDNELGNAIVDLGRGINGYTSSDGYLLNPNQTETIDPEKLINMDETRFNEIVNKDKLDEIFVEAGFNPRLSSTVWHEITHYIERTGRWNDYRNFVKEFMGAENFETLVDRIDKVYKAKAKTTPQMDLRGFNPEHEAVAFFTQTQFGNPAFLERLSSYNNSVFNRLWSNTRALFTGDEKVKLENLFQQAFYDASQKAELAGTPAYSIGSLFQAVGMVVEKDSEHTIVAIDENGERRRKISVEDVKKSPLGQMLKESSLAGYITEEDYNNQTEMMTNICNSLLKTQDADMFWALSGSIGYNQAPVGADTSDETKRREFTAFTTNADKQYSTTFDVITICTKTQQLIDVASQLMVKLGRGLTQEEIINIVYDEVNKAGEPVPCPVCYVFSRWVGLGGTLNDIKNFQIKYRNADLEAIKSRYEALCKQVDEIAKKRGKDFGKAKDSLREEVDQEVLKRYGDLYSEDVTEKLGGKKMSAEDRAEMESLKKDLEILNDWSWVTNVLLSVKTTKGKRTITLNQKWLDRGEVPDKILFDLNRGEDFSEYAAWNYRVTRGAALGKVITPYTDMVLGQTILGFATPSTVSDLGEYRSAENNAFLGNDQAEQDKKLWEAIANAKVQNLKGGSRAQSTSDFRFEFVTDYILHFMQLQAIGSYGQTYTKVPEAVPMLCSVGYEVNMSLMPKGKGYMKAKKGDPYAYYVEGFEGVEDGWYTLEFSEKTGIKTKEAFYLREQFDNAQTIMVGINDVHNYLSRLDPRIDYIIPYHASGGTEVNYQTMMDIIGEAVAKGARTSYEKSQNDKRVKNPTVDQRRAYELREKILGGEAKYLSEEEKETLGKSDFLTELWRRFYEKGYDPECYGVVMDGESTEKGIKYAIFPYEYWDKTSTRETADVNGRRFAQYCEELGIVPRFSQWTSETGYWKTLIDRSMYNRDGSYHVQKAINMNDFNTNFLYRGKMVEGLVQPDEDETKSFDRNKTSGIVEKAKRRILAEGGQYEIGRSDDNAGYHYGEKDLDLNFKSERLATRGGRGTGAFGTGTYFFGDGRFDSTYMTDPNKTEHKVDFSDYNLFRPNNSEDGLRLHRLFKELDDNYSQIGPKSKGELKQTVSEIINELNQENAPLTLEQEENIRNRLLELGDSEQFVDRMLDESRSEQGEILAGYLADDLNQRYIEEDAWSKSRRPRSLDYAEDYENMESHIPELAQLLGVEEDYMYDIVNEAITSAEADTYKRDFWDGNYDSVGTRVLKKLGYDGIDVRNMEGLDNSTYGSVIYDLKPETIQYNIGRGDSSGGDGNNNRPDVEVTDGYSPRKNQRFATSNIPKSDIFNDSQKARVEQKVKAGEFTYQSYINKVEAQRAEDYYKIDGKEATFNRFMAINNPDMKSTVMGEILLKHMLEENDPRWEEVASKLADDATIAGQFLQAYAMMQKLTPQGKLMAIRRNMERLQKRVNNRFGNKAPRLELNQKLVDDLMNASPKESKQIQDAIYKDLMNQIPKTFRDAINAWRYLMMLGNPRTHIRNMAGNGIFAPAINIKDAIGTVLETISPIKLDYKTKAFINRFNASDRALLEAGNKAFDTYKSALEQNQKYERSGFSDNNPIGRFLNRLANKNSELLDKEDFFFSKRRYAKAYAQFLKANNLTPDNLSVEMENRANSYAELEALRATYRDANSVAELLSKISSDSDSEGLRMASYFKDALIPFTKTPMNIVKRGVRYSPVGLLYTITKNSYDLHTGKINTNEYIDSLAQGLTGTGIALLGMLLRSLGLFRTKDDDKDRKQYFDAENGEQDYAIDLSPFGVEGTYTIDWASPVIMPFAIGAELFDAFTDLEGFEGFEDVTNAIADVSAKVMDPIMETSMLSSLQDALKSYSTEGGEWLGEMVASMASSYFQQLFPTLGGQIARTIDDTRRTTYPNSGIVNKTVKQIMNKIPWLSMRNQPYINRQGQEEKTEDLGMGWVGRAFLNMVSPGYYSSKDIDEYDGELYRLYDSTMNLDAFPSSTSTKITHEGTDMKFTPEEYTEWHKMRWQTETKYANDFIDSQSYQSLTDEERVATIKDIREYAQKVAKKQFLESKGYIYTDDKELAETDSKYIYDKQLTNAQGALDNDIPLYAYYDYLNNAGSKQAEKMQYLENSGLSQKQKEYLWDTEGYKKSYNDVYRKVFGGKSKSSGKSSSKSSTKKSGIKKGSGSKSGKATTLKATSTRTNNVNTRIANSYFNAYSNQMGRRNVSTGGSSSTTCPRCKNVVVPVNGRCPICGNILE